MYVFFHVVPQPKIIEPPVSQSVLVLQNATFTCNAIGYKVKYRWISISGSFSSRAIGINSYRLTIVNVIPSDDGMYKCVTTNEGGRTESNAVQLRVLGMYVCMNNNNILDHYQYK